MTGDYLALLHAFELEWILWLQSYDWLDIPMSFFTLAGSQGTFLVLFLAIYWSYDVREGFQFGLVLLIVGCFNTILKSTFHLPRPYWIDPRVRTIFHEESFGMPSGHAQITIATFGLVGVFFRRKLVWLLILFFIFMIGLSRVYLGVHFFSDVLVGWWIGALLLFLLLVLAPGIRKRFLAKPEYSFVLLGLWLGLGFLLTGILLFEFLSNVGWVVPVDWIENALLAFPYEPPIDPLSLETIGIAAGTLVGFAAGGWLMIRRQVYDVRGSILQHLSRYLVGVGGVGVIYFLGSLVVPDTATWQGAVSIFVTFILIGLWISFFAPLAFIKLRLVNSQPAAEGV